MQIKVRISKFIGYGREVSYELFVSEVKKDDTSVWEEDIAYKRAWDKKDILNELSSKFNISEKEARNLGLNFRNGFSTFTYSIEEEI